MPKDTKYGVDITFRRDSELRVKWVGDVPVVDIAVTMTLTPKDFILAGPPIVREDTVRKVAELCITEICGPPE